VTEPRTLARLAYAVPLALPLAFVGLVAASLVGWSLDPDASLVQRVWSDKWLLLTSAFAGGAAGAILARAFSSKSTWRIVGAAIGVLPAFLKTSAYFTSAY
jgi:hypothetical protein